MKKSRIWLAAAATSAVAALQFVGPGFQIYRLPNGWRLTPIGNAVALGDTVLNLTMTPGKDQVLALNSGFQPHALTLFHARTGEVEQRVSLPTSWLGLAWHPSGDALYVSGGNDKNDPGGAPIYELRFSKRRLSEKPTRVFRAPAATKQVYWAGLVHHPRLQRLYAANRTTGNVVVFDTADGGVQGSVHAGDTLYGLALSDDGKMLYVSDWARAAIRVIDTERLAMIKSIPVGSNPNDLRIFGSRLFVACANDNMVKVIALDRLEVAEEIRTSMFPQAPAGSTPNAIAISRSGDTLFVANADNNTVAVVDISNRQRSRVLGFLPTGWYPSAVAVSEDGSRLFVGSSKGIGGSRNNMGQYDRQDRGGYWWFSLSSIYGTVHAIDLKNALSRIDVLTAQCRRNSPYSDERLAMAPESSEPSVVPRNVGAGSPIRHVIYIIKENRTYDQVLGDLPRGNGDPQLTIFGRRITPNHHKLAEEFVTLDNLFCDGEVSADGHEWSNAAYATDYVEKTWPAAYAYRSEQPGSLASVPPKGYLWDACARKGLTYRSYGESVGKRLPPELRKHATMGLEGHMAPNYKGWGARDYENAREFIREFDEFEKNYDSSDPNVRLPNYIVMCLPEDHTKGTRIGEPTPIAAVASNDYGLGLIVERVSHSRYWPNIAIFVIEDDPQDGPDHVDNRRTVGFVISPYCRRRAVDSTHYTTSSMLRTMELLLGLPPMTQYDAGATPMYRSLRITLDVTPYNALKPLVDIEERNRPGAYGAARSGRMQLDDYDEADAQELNEILWRNVRGVSALLPVPVTGFGRSSYLAFRAR